MPKLTPEERKRLLQLVEEQSPLGQEWLEKLFPPRPAGELFWEGKAEAYARTQRFLSSLDQGKKSLHSPSTPPPFIPALPADWAGLLFQADNLSLLRYLLQSGSHLGLSPSPFSLIYIDPPFFTETDFHATPLRAAQGKADTQGLQRKKGVQDSLIGRDSESTEERVFAYSDTWEGGKAEYFTMLYERIMLMRELLSPRGVLCVHCDWRAVPGARFMLDECFGQDAFVNEIIWHYTGGGRSKRYFSRKHDSILLYAKGKEWTFNIDAVRVPYKKTSGYAKAGIVSRAGKRYMPNPLGTPLDDVWDIPMLNPMAKERVPYATQKPGLLLKRIIEALTNEGDIVGDFFCGSGTTLVEALAHNRRVIGCDFGSQAVEVTRERLKNNGFLSQEHSPLMGASETPLLPKTSLSDTPIEPISTSDDLRLFESLKAWPFFSFRSSR